MLIENLLGMIMLGYLGTTAVTVDDMIHHIRPAAKGVPNIFNVGDMPLGPYNVSIEWVTTSANRI